MFARKLLLRSRPQTRTSVWKLLCLAPLRFRLEIEKDAGSTLSQLVTVSRSDIAIVMTTGTKP